ncbi:low molecular weight protein arginine phosphatase [Pseudalkalibacillus salsuginis]|uniref:low molecular weight protein arginine phosphatase n=1 Tax=Pseudalkalibacillus salsuginis TaxID=2910972 RepID=UPI001F438D70|nr:low molecular weight protein arginine phosphatase [Pseudalkalibacillus salsuginis]MCF6410918.1 low molecular weight protein arginine phosphatase [Pseudalkalibacillus salsuginis]
MNILFVCTGNTCRSPMAEALLRHYSTGKIEVQSAGIYASYGSPASAQSIEVLKDEGIPCHHKSQPLTEDLAEWADLILTMTSQHKYVIISQFPDKMGKVHTIKEHVSNHKGTLDKLERIYDKIEQLRVEIYDVDEGDKNRRALSAKMNGLIEEAEKLEQSMPVMDVSDPFGGTKETYCQTFKELDELVQKLTEKYS